jgi:competence protein ComEC
MDYIIKNCNIGAFYMPDKSHTTDFYTDMLNALLKKDIKAVQARAGVTVSFDDQLTCEFLAPSGSSYKDLNDYSAVLKITYGATSFLLEADAESVSEREMVRRYGDQLSSDVLKVGHHGNDSSSTDAFLKRVKPKYSVISMADIAQYDKPEKMKSFFSRFTKNGGQLFRTDVHGDVTFISDGKTITVKTEK